MPIGFLLLFLLSSCSADAANHQAVLDEYAEITQSGGSFEGVLTQSALVQADASRRLLDDLGYTQRGRARFEIWSISESLVSGCLDLSQVVIIDSDGAFLYLAERRSQFSATLTSGNLISNFQVIKEKC